MNDALFVWLLYFGGGMFLGLIMAIILAKLGFSKPWAAILGLAALSPLALSLFGIDLDANRGVLEYWGGLGVGLLLWTIFAKQRA